jgi:hypothetical protein
MGRKKAPPLTRGDRRRLQIRQILFALIAVLVITSFVVSMLVN